MFPGGALIGCDAGFLNAPRIKGSHAAIKSGMMAADAAFDAVTAGRCGDELAAYPAAFEASWLYDELHRARNFKPYLDKGLMTGAVLFGVDQLVFRGKAPWTLHRRKADHEKLKPAAECAPISYPKPDGTITFDKLSSVFLSNTNHEENQPAHLTLKDPVVPTTVNLARYAGPEQRYCPAAVYEFVQADGGERLQINFQNCVHCKTCDIKDPTQNIVWVTPEGGGGPNYVEHVAASTRRACRSPSFGRRCPLHCTSQSHRGRRMGYSSYHKRAISSRELHPETQMMSYGYDPFLSEGAVKPPVFLTSTFAFRTAEDGAEFFDVVAGRKSAPADTGAGLVYSRFNHPNLEIVEDRLALLDHAEDAIVTSSGMAAIGTVLLTFLRPGDQVVHSTPLYGGTETLLRKILPEWGIGGHPLVSGLSAAEMETTLETAAARGRVGLFYVETPANPTNSLIDLQAVVASIDRFEQKHGYRPISACDNTMLGPIFQHPIREGIDLSIYSLDQVRRRAQRPGGRRRDRPS